MSKPVERVLYLNGRLNTTEIKMKGSLTSGVGDIYKVFEGPYTIVPKVTDQTLNTKFKILKDEVIVKEIPYVEITNPAGGSTFIIGGE